jgi:formylglycine-generating enzyme required for sulfatase activity
MYPHGASPVGAVDMAGNVWEFCLNEFDLPRQVGLTGEARRVLRGGSYNDDRPDVAGTAFRGRVRPSDRNDNVGFRVVCTSPTVSFGSSHARTS